MTNNQRLLSHVLASRHTLHQFSNSMGIRNIKINTQCAKCHAKCCHRTHDYVYLIPEEVEALAKCTGQRPQIFALTVVNKYLRASFRILRFPCTFFDLQTGMCTIYEHRPLICRLFPFCLDPTSAEIIFEPWQCGANLAILPKDAVQGWSLDEYVHQIERWYMSFWQDAIGGAAN